VKTIILLRHAKSDWNASFERDHERPINERGRQAADRVGRFLVEADQVPDAVVTSSAVRARTTVERAMAAGGWSCPVEVTDRLYEASPGEVLSVIQGLSPQVDRVLLAGHEPTWSTLVEEFTGARAKVVTAALVCIELAVPDWRRVTFGGGQLLWFLPPRLLVG
jgi:phosphohistidine phosphatase